WESVLHLRTPVRNVQIVFFFSSRRRHTRFSRDWSSDVCSSDLRERADAMFVAGRMAQTEAFERQARGAAPRGEFDPVIARAATSADAQERVRAMGLVGQPDSLARLTRLLNSSDPAFTPEMRSALARATLEATRTELIRTG